MARKARNERQDPMRELRRLLEAPLRRPWLVLLPLAACLVAAVALSLSLEPRYRSSTLILVRSDRVPTEFVPQMTTERIDRRLQTLRQEVMSRSRLEAVATALDPYRLIGREPTSVTIERMRDAVTVSVKGKDAFSIEFEHTDPKMAMMVAGRLTTLFMEEVVGEREDQVAHAYEFIQEQLEEARAELEKKEAALRDFKQRHMGTLPEQVTSNLSTLQRLQVEHQTVADSLRQAMDTLLLLESGLTPSGAPANRGVAPARPEDSLAGLRAELQQRLTRYTPEHPDVVSLKARIATLEVEARAAAAVRAAETPEDEAERLDPAEANARAQILKSRSDVAHLQQRLAEVEQHINKLQGNVNLAPQREQELLTLTRDYEQMGENYAELLSKKLDAEMSSELEKFSKGGQFKILDDAIEAESPFFPNHWLFALGGVMSGLLLGLGLTVVVDFLDPTLKDLEDVREVLPFPVVAVMPHVKPKDARRLAAAGASSDAIRPVDSARARGAKKRTVPFRPRLRGGKNR